METTYTAQEMRHAANLIEAWGNTDEVNNMLRQAADMIEREAAKAAKMPRVGYGDRFYVVPYKAMEVKP